MGRHETDYLWTRYESDDGRSHDQTDLTSILTPDVYTIFVCIELWQMWKKSIHVPGYKASKPDRTAWFQDNPMLRRIENLFIPHAVDVKLPHHHPLQGLLLHKKRVHTHFLLFYQVTSTVVDHYCMFSSYTPHILFQALQKISSTSVLAMNIWATMYWWYQTQGLMSVTSIEMGAQKSRSCVTPSKHSDSIC